ncbi:MAG TPA: FAD-dependent oxidoreductase [Cryomorphaceae bacterium]|nr:FAD-dependent oxidoreductase [Owenweeksia sp.]HAD95810.1 FAD-dependent oxidoreductase [Cryomorphaceae bacterium]HBF21605.1 FAD-dependent oxidoreductase [Cryomorphaceae bacterium]
MKRFKSKEKCIIIGGGLAGLISSIDLKQRGYEVELIEKRRYPFHRVCGEFISNEVRPYLFSLGIFPHEINYVNIDQFILSSETGRFAQCRMQMGGLGISRYSLDHFLYTKALQNGVLFTEATVEEVVFEDSHFKVRLANSEERQAALVIGAFGKRSALDKRLNRAFMKERSAYMGIKWHMYAELPANTVALHHFRGGYAGLSRVEEGKVNFCYLTTGDVFRQYRDIDDMEAGLLRKNPHLDDFLSSATRAFEKPEVISQVSFAAKAAVEEHILMCGDAAGLIHPLCGNGMAMAIHSAMLACSEADRFLSGKVSRLEMERAYSRQWKKAFHTRLTFGKYAQKLMESPPLFAGAIRLATASPYLLKKAVGLSHGKPLLQRA